MTNFVRNHALRRLGISDPLTSLTKESVPLEWSEDYKNSFNSMKKAVGEKVLLVRPRLDKKIIHGQMPVTSKKIQR